MCPRTQVELDGDIIQVAEQWFGFTKDRTRLAVHVGDGVAFVEGLAERIAAAGQPQEGGADAADEARAAQQQRLDSLEAPEPEPEPEPAQGAAGPEWSLTSRSCKYDAIVIDVDTKDSSLGMSCPPAAFLAPDYLRCLRASLDDNGILIVNIVARSDELYDGAIKSLGAVFPVVLEMAVEEDINRIAIAMMSRRSGLSSSGLVKTTLELHKAAGATWGAENPNAVWTEEVTSAAKTALSTVRAHHPRAPRLACTLSSAPATVRRRRLWQGGLGSLHSSSSSSVRLSKVAEARSLRRRRRRSVSFCLLSSLFLATFSSSF